MASGCQDANDIIHLVFGILRFWSVKRRPKNECEHRCPGAIAFVFGKSPWQRQRSRSPGLNYKSSWTPHPHVLNRNILKSTSAKLWAKTSCLQLSTLISPGKNFFCFKKHFWGIPSGRAHIWLQPDPDLPGDGYDQFQGDVTLSDRTAEWPEALAPAPPLHVGMGTKHEDPYEEEFI